jgi:UDP-N-acetylmuramoyl-tripeptide--D-alanyl-D-alanine ligase
MVTLVAWSIVGTFLVVITFRTRPEQKKPLVYTARAKRLIATSTILTLVVGAWVLTFMAKTPASAQYPSNRLALITLLASLVMIQFSPAMIIIANIILVPFQMALNQVYLRKARGRLREVKPLTVGITGSYGKTSTKFFLEILLKRQFRVLKTPASFNTLLGIAKTVNEELRDSTEVFIAELGAYRKGDIAELSRFVNPRIGILTAVGPQHLERFGSLDAIEATKGELLDALPKDGVAVVNGDDPRCRRLATKKALRGGIVKLFGLDNSLGDLALWATDVASGPDGLSFRMVDGQGHEVRVQTALLGRHNISNLLGAALVALELGVHMERVGALIREIQPAPHRLQLSKTQNGIVVIDDSYNSNPIGAAAALDALAELNGGKKILVTPGMIELGDRQVVENREFGKKAAATCDFVVLVGTRQTAPLAAGLLDAGFPTEQTRIVNNLHEARVEVERVATSGDVVLFENDLPDLYVEA